tara:strand:+ start:387 stop:491 length:105 start_codon:yes stop_codon:yes gene_type:complete
LVAFETMPLRAGVEAFEVASTLISEKKEVEEGEG